MKIRKINEDISDTIKPKVFTEMIASASDFYTYLEENEEYFGFTQDEFHDVMCDYLFTEDKLSSRYSQDWCRKVINKEDGAKDKYWDKCRPYYPAILKFMEDYKMETIRFYCDW